MDPLQGDVVHMKPPLPDINIKDINDKDQPIIVGTNNVLEKVSSLSSSSTSSDDSSEEDFFQLDPLELNKSIQGNDVTEDAQLVAFETRPQDGGGSSSSCADGVSNFLDDDDDDDLVSGPQTVSRPFSSDLSVTNTPPNTTTSSSILVEQTQSPPVQMMVRADVPDPNRIPSSVFARTSTTSPMEWSTASNESLFSIHMGNSSFSRDHVLLFTGKSGDMSSYSSSPVDSYPPPLPPLSPTNPFVVDMHQQGSSQSHAAETVNPSADANGSTSPNANANFMKDALTAHVERDSNKDLHSAPGVRLTPSISQQSDGSASSFRSFAFPILTGDGRNVSVKVEAEHQDQVEKPEKSDQPDPQIGAPQAAASAATGNRWFPCFSCSFCC